MKNTSIKLTDAKCAKIMAGLDNLPQSERDNTWNQIREEIKQVQDVWKNIDIKAFHRSKVVDRAKSNKGS